jgi:hypothetical protein
LSANSKVVPHVSSGIVDISNSKQLRPASGKIKKKKTGLSLRPLSFQESAFSCVASSPKQRIKTLMKSAILGKIKDNLH